MGRLGKWFGGDSGNDDPAAFVQGVDAGDAAPSALELTEFAPRQDGDYHCAERGLYLRFARPSVTETVVGAAGAAIGEFTLTGRWAVQRAFERPVVFTVLGAFDTSSETLTVRRTDTASRESAVVHYVFEPDG